MFLQRARFERIIEEDHICIFSFLGFVELQTSTMANSFIRVEQ